MTNRFAIIVTLLLAIGVAFPVGAQTESENDTIRTLILKDFPPQFVSTPDGPSGLAVELMREVAQRAALKIEFVTVSSWKDVYAPLENGTVDALSNMGVSASRQEAFEFTDPYEVFDIKLFVRTETSDIETVDDLDGRLLGVQATNVLTKGLMNSGKYSIKQYPSFNLALLGLLSGEVDALPAPSEPFLLVARQARLDYRVKPVGPSLLEVKRAIALPKGRLALRDRLNEALRAFKQTEDYQALLTKWYGAPTPYWTPIRMLIVMGVTIMGAIASIGAWRYYSLRAMNRRIREREQRFDVSQEFAKIGSWDWNILTGELIWSNQIFEMFGYKDRKTATTYESFLNAIHPDDRSAVVDAVDACIKDDKVYDIEHRVVWPNGTVRWLHESGNVARDSEGTPLNMLGIVRDVTHSKLMENKLNEALVEAEKANKAKSEFLASMSHELRTPLNAISGFSQMLKHEVFGKHSDPRYLEYAKDIEGSAKHLIDIIGDVLDLSKIEAGKLDPTPTRFALHPTIDDCVRLIAAKTPEHPDRVRTEYSEDTDTLNTDIRLFRQIMLNLLSNADKYTPLDGAIVVSSERDDDNNIVVRVSDNGVGIDPEDLQVVLEPFGQGRENVELTHEGTGLGLPLAKSLMETQGGELRLTSEVGVGTTVTLVFPNIDV